MNAATQHLTADGRAMLDLLGAEIARVGWSETARRSGVCRINLHRTFGPTRSVRAPNLATLCAIAEALGFELTVRKA
jgi:DNA-binding phage protein